MTYCVKQLSIGDSGPGCEVNAVTTTVKILRGTPDNMEPVVGHLLQRLLVRLLRPPWVDGGKDGLTGGWLVSGPATATVGPLPAFPPETTEASVNGVSDVGRELGGVGMYAGTGFRQPIP